MDLRSFTIAVPVAVDTVDVVRPIQWMASPGITNLAFLFNAPTFAVSPLHLFLMRLPPILTTMIAFYLLQKW